MNEIDQVIDELCTALLHTAEYASLPALEGWSWFDALNKYRPDMLPGNDTWLCPNCWHRWHIALRCPNCGPHPPIGLYRHPPVDPITEQISAGDDAILMGQMRHCDVPEGFRRLDCVRVMDDHGWKDDGTRDGVAVCPPHA
jgi:hypothetical protein